MLWVVWLNADCSPEHDGMFIVAEEWLVRSWWARDERKLAFYRAIGTPVPSNVLIAGDKRGGRCWGMSRKMQWVVPVTMR